MLRTIARTSPGLSLLTVPARSLLSRRRAGSPSPARAFFAVAAIVFVIWLAGVAWAASLALADRGGTSAVAPGGSVAAGTGAERASARLDQLEAAYVATLASMRASDDVAPAGVAEVAAGLLGYAAPPKTAPKPPVLVNGKYRAGTSVLNTAGADLYDCANFATWEDAQAVYRANLPGDPNGLDANGNGIACDSLLRR